MKTIGKYEITHASRYGIHVWVASDDHLNPGDNVKFCDHLCRSIWSDGIWDVLRPIDPISDINGLKRHPIGVHRNTGYYNWLLTRDGYYLGCRPDKHVRSLINKNKAKVEGTILLSDDHKLGTVLT